MLTPSRIDVIDQDGMQLVESSESHLDLKLWPFTRLLFAVKTAIGKGREREKINNNNFYDKNIITQLEVLGQGGDVPIYPKKSTQNWPKIVPNIGPKNEKDVVYFIYPKLVVSKINDIPNT